MNKTGIILQNIVFPFGRSNECNAIYFGRYKKSTNIKKFNNSFEMLSKKSIKIKAGSLLSLASYENAFPVSYWNNHTKVKEISFCAKFDRDVTVRIYSSSFDGGATLQIELVGRDFNIPYVIENFESGGWIWAEIEASKSEDATLLEAHWSLEQMIGLTNDNSAIISICTMNKPDFVIHNLQKLKTAIDESPQIKQIVVVDQGTQKVKEHKDYAEIKKSLGNNLTIIEQTNLGGAGGFSRGMLEAYETFNTSYVILLDDDTDIEPETFHRMTTFASLCYNDTIVGAHMFYTDNTSTLHSFSEILNPGIMNWGASNGTEPAFDLGLITFSQASWLHRYYNSDYTGWWCCLIPTKVIKKIGLALPIFIKYDDFEYGLRAKKFANCDTVSLPGAFVWHEGWWYTKEDNVDWQVFYHTRNRILLTLLYSREKIPVKFLIDLFLNAIKYNITLRYSAVKLMEEAIKSILSGHECMVNELPTRLNEINELRKNYDDGIKIKLEHLPKHHNVFNKKTKNKLLFFLSSLIFQLSPYSRSKFNYYVNGNDPMRAMKLMHANTAVYASVDGENGYVYHRDRKKFVKGAIFISKEMLRLVRSWPRLSIEYKKAHKQFSSIDSWKQFFK